MIQQKNYDTVICGGGLAGLTLARQLRRSLPKLSIAVLDKTTRPLPHAAHKVGESTVEVGAHYLAQVLGLEDYLEKNHLHKQGLRYFFPGPTENFADRPEYGLSEFPLVHSYQLDRGILENDLRALNQSHGIEILEGVSVQDILLSTSAGVHEVAIKNNITEATSFLKCKWVIDAMGQRRFLQAKLGLTKPRSDEKHSAAWFRVDAKVDVTDFVPQENRDWHDRVANHDRYYSTNHLMGDGYWVWLIPLSSGCTSIGIVTLESVHAFSQYNTHDRAKHWLAQHEPVLAAHIAHLEPIDFMARRNYTYDSKRVFSSDRWACSGDAGVFSDPFYSPGTDVLGFTNSIITKLISADVEHQLSNQLVDNLNYFLLAYNGGLTRNIQSGYPFLGRDLVMAAKLLWDCATGWALSGPLMFNQFYLDEMKAHQIFRVTSRFTPLSFRMQKFFQEWASKTSSSNSFGFIDYLSIPFLRELRQRNLQQNKSVQELLDDHVVSMETLDQLAQAIFRIAVEDVAPEALSRVSTGWLNTLKISLDPATWESEGLFKPATVPPISDRINQQVRGLFALSNRALEGASR